MDDDDGLILLSLSPDFDGSFDELRLLRLLVLLRCLSPDDFFDRLDDEECDRELLWCRLDDDDSFFDPSSVGLESFTSDLLPFVASSTISLFSAALTFSSPEMVLSSGA